MALTSTKPPEIPYEEAYRRVTACIHPARSAAQADLYRLEWGGEPALLKDFSLRPRPIRATLGRIALARELRILHILQGIEGIPRLIGRAGPHALVMEELSARRLPRNREKPPSPEFFDRLSKLVEAVHSRGVAHGDLRRLNIMMDAEERPYLIDFATSVAADAGPAGFFSRWLYARVAAVDLVTFARIKSEFYPDGLTDEERRRLAEAPWYLRMGKFLKKKVYRLRKPHHRRAVMRRLKAKFSRSTGE